MTYTDAFGMKVTYGRDEAKDLNGLVDVTHFGAVHQITQVIDFDANGMPKAGAEDLTIRSSKIPAGSAVLSAKAVVLSAATEPGTTINVGTVRLDGTAIAENGLVAAAALSTGVKAGEGALIGTVVTEDSYIKVTPSAAGADALGGLKAVLVIEYV